MKKNFAIISLIIAKVLGITGVVLGFSSGILRIFGGTLLGFSALAIVSCIVFCLIDLKEQNKKSEEEDNLTRSLNKLRNTLKITKLELEGLQAKRDLAQFMTKM